jgi:hypothetical protein
VQRITLLLGAGSSCPFDYPTTKQFFERLVPKINNHNQKLILTILTNIGAVKDIEHVLQIIDTILDFDLKPNIRNTLNGIFGSNLTPSDALNSWEFFTKELSSLKSVIINELYSEYSLREKTKGKAFEAYEGLFGIGGSSKIVFRDVFTLNYDRTMEEYFLDKQEGSYTDGFRNKRNGRFWSPKLFNDEKKSFKFRLFKLHGSLCWREKMNGDIECVTPEEPSRSGQYKRNVLIYPTEKCNTTQEPYSTLYNYFESLDKTADILGIIGYAFRDEPINNIILKFAKKSSQPNVVVISPTAVDDLMNPAGFHGKVISDTELNKDVKIVEIEGRSILVIEGKFPDTPVLKKLNSAISLIEKFNIAENDARLSQDTS